MTSIHIPILKKTIVDLLLPSFKPLDPQQTGIFLDCTFGGGGHTGEMLDQLNRLGVNYRVIAIDQDAQAVREGEQKFSQYIAAGRLALKQCRMSQLPEMLPQWIQTGEILLGILADLGFSSDQLDNPERGLSFRAEGPLDFRLDATRPFTAYQVLDQSTEQEIERILREYGEERFSKKIASALVDARHAGRLPKTTTELTQLIVRAMPPSARHGRIHAATRSFQALRIAVNQELEELDALLEHVILFLSPGGSAAIMSFHSLEDRKVKQRFKALSQSENAEFTQVLKKPYVPSREEIEENSRARSAKLRVITRGQRGKTQGMDSDVGNSRRGGSRYRNRLA